MDIKIKEGGKRRCSSFSPIGAYSKQVCSVALQSSNVTGEAGG